ncbi:deoxyguanosinetriphosphate triphosphohydrolase family protein [Anaerorhabdus sp.]|uniref:deoxyguanosinetriphosphate triphosphohydrolase family protein n=1 Tax=Anaerorhabdus sp. TaxID=1872524 RepID=UPI002FCBB22F
MFEQFDEFYILKVKVENIGDTFEKDSGKFFVKNTNDLNFYKNIKKKFILVVITFETNQMVKKPVSLCICKCIKNEVNNWFTFSTKARSEDLLRINDFTKNISLDLTKDFDKKTYWTIEYATKLLEEFYISTIYSKKKWECDFRNNSRHNCKKFGQEDANAIYVYDDNKLNNTRTKFDRDRDRLIHSKANRRLVDKAQIFTASKGDHYRTRMTHTIEVTQIARTIARKLELNETLTEAIAIGHDFGHTPFGHIGERTLDSILNGEIIIITDIDKNDELKQRFKHNYQALRVLTYLEEKYENMYGLNLSMQILEGILKHTKLGKNQDDKDSYKIDDFLKYPTININGNFEKTENYLYLKQDFSSTLEGQVVKIADEIAQRSHDIDDAFKAKKINHETFSKYTNIKKAKKIFDVDLKINNKINEVKEKGMIFVDETDIYRAQISSEIIDYFIDDVIEISTNNMNLNKVNSDGIYTQELIQFSNEAKEINDMLENIVKSKVINSSEVAKFDKTAAKVIVDLFEYYYENPKCLESTTLKRIYKEMLVNGYSTIDFVNGNIDLVYNEIKKINNFDLSKLSEEMKTEYQNKRKILARSIADYISGMTDTYALNEYQRINNMR